MAISRDQAEEWAEYFIRQANDFYEYSDVYEDEEFTDDYPDEEDWKTVHEFMTMANISINWDNEKENN